ncbi:DUF397 domain-containing protein [Streptomyces actinomycinicus]|uniref:DUF397 domain-containing protein n=1 Tax=Streptomyces actinomycinicus TaxID=1695166 RepID=A0A937EFZ6_9ACTN|nr:DUF397 domain-containing protein [Streptomyces actinomycinicus]MBL1081692.1 DUF397 domain-containing protein [Streptomyces actinomycinicus]
MSAPLQWFKSTYSSSEGGQCLEAAVAWGKSRLCGGLESACVDVAARSVHVRDSKLDPSQGPTLRLTPTAWAAFTSTLG